MPPDTLIEKQKLDGFRQLIEGMIFKIKAFAFESAVNNIF